MNNYLVVNKYEDNTVISRHRTLGTAQRAIAFRYRRFEKSPYVSSNSIFPLDLVEMQEDGSWTQMPWDEYDGINAPEGY